MSRRTPPRLLELAMRSLLRDEALAIATLEELPIELFPPLFMEAFAGKCREALKAMVQAWPFTCLPLGALMREQQPQQENLDAVLSGLDMLLAQEVRPRRWELQVLDLRKNAHRDFWPVWSGGNPSELTLMEAEEEQPFKKRRMESCRTGAKQPSPPLEVLIDLCLKEGSRDELLSTLVKKVRQEKGLHLCCKKLRIFAVSMKNIKMILKMVQLDSVQDLEVNCTWKLSTLGNFAVHLGQMANLRRLLLFHIHVSVYPSPEEEEQCVNQFAAQFRSLRHLEELYLDSVTFLQGRLNQMFRYLKSPLEILSIANCVLLESDLMYLSQCPFISQLKELGLSGVSLAGMNPEPLQVLVERASATIQYLDLDECGITDSQFTAILPALSHCFQLTTFSFCGNPLSMAVLENLLLHTIGLSKLSHVLYPAPRESYEDTQGTIHLGRLAQLHARLRQMLHDSGCADVVWFSANPCPRCGDRTFYDPEPFLRPC